MQVRRFWLSLASAATLAMLGCGQANSPVVQTAVPGASGEAYSVQQESGTTTCLRRYRLCLRTLVPDLGSQAVPLCQERRDACINALGEGYFYRGGRR